MRTPPALKKEGFLLQSSAPWSLFLIFQISWTLTLTPYFRQHLWLSLILALLLWSFRSWFWPWNLRQQGRAFLFTSMGFAFDLLWIALGLFQLLNPPSWPWWLLSLWCQFTSVLPLLAPRLPKNRALLFLIGGAGGTMSYYMGTQMGAVVFTWPPLYGIYFIFWGFFILRATHFFQSKEL